MKKTPFNAVSVTSRTGSRCAAAKSIQGVRYLCHEAPALPLPACEHRETCRCVYQHHEDRRHDHRRDADAGIGGLLYLGVERRDRPGRRATDRSMTPQKVRSG